MPPPDQELRMPLELIDEIVRHVIPSSSHVKHDLKKIHWPCIRSLSLSSHRVRRAALDCWFYSLFIRCSSDWQWIEGMFSSVDLVKTVSRLHIFAAALDPQSIHRLTRYEKLRTLSVNMHVLWSESPDSLHTARELVPFIPSSLTSLEISCMSPDQCRPDLLASLAGACPSLERLGFYSAASDCEACKEEITLPFPIPDWSPSANALANSLAESLSKLKRIKSISLPIHLSPADIYEAHLSGGHPLRRTLDRESSCPRCVEDYGPRTISNEETVAQHMGNKLVSLRALYFPSWVYGNGKGAVSFVRATPHVKLDRSLVQSYANTQDWDGGRLHGRRVT